MLNSDGRKHFIVKHGLDAFEALPSFIWNTCNAPDAIPHRYDQVKLGDRWIGFAYTTSDNRERPLSFVTGFYECVEEASYRDIPLVDGRWVVTEGKKKAWMIEGKPCGDQPKWKVAVPPIDTILDKKKWKNQGIVPITLDDFEKIKKTAIQRQFDPNTIPLLKREPKNEQELLAIVVCGHQKFGIERIVEVGKAFPDLLIKIAGKDEEIYLELELYSGGFFSHHHELCVQDKCVRGKPVAVLCWIDNPRPPKNDCEMEQVTDCVERVYELQSLIREGKQIVW